MAITNLSDLANRLTGGSSGDPQHAWFYFENRIAGTSTVQTTVNRVRSLWRINKSNGAHGAVPGSTALTNCASSVVGALPIRASAQTTALYTYLLGMDVTVGASAAGTYIVYDRLQANAALVHNSSATQGTGSTALLRYNSTVSTAANFAGGNQIWLEVYTAISATAALTEVVYTNQAGTTGRTSKQVLLGGANSSAVGSVVVVPLADGDSGVLSVESVKVTVAQGTAGSFGVTIARPLLAVPVNLTGWGMTRDTLSGFPSMPRVEPGACLAFSLLASNAGDPAGMMSLHFVDG
jgi:hypothetical protein